MCKCFQYCLESCYWHLIEKRFCYDESIALYEPPEKDEKNNNFFDNLAFYDSVSVIAGRAIVTIEALPAAKTPIVEPIVHQPRRMRWTNDNKPFLSKEYKSKSVPTIYESNDEELENKPPNAEPILEPLKQDDMDKPKSVEDLLLPPEASEPRKKSLRERRMSKSLYLKIEQPKEIPIIRQHSMPKFYLDTPDESLQAAMFLPSTVLSPVPKKAGYEYDLYSVVQMERERVQNLENQTLQRKESERALKLSHITKIKLRRVKSSLGTITNLPHSHHHM